MKLYINGLKHPGIIFLVASLTVFSTSSLGAQKNEKDIKIIQFLGDQKAGEFALIGANADDGFGMGVLLKSYRPSKNKMVDGPLLIETGELKVVGNRDGYAFAQILSDSTEISKQLYPKFPGPMAQDIVVPSKIKISKQSAILPILEMSYFNLFEDPNSKPSNFELSDTGKKQLLESTEKFRDARVSMIIIEGHTSYKGKSEANQIESYERAKTVRGFLLSQYSLEPKKVLAVGYGESILKDKSLTAGHQQRNRRIVIKAINVDTSISE